MKMLNVWRLRRRIMRMRAAFAVANQLRPTVRCTHCSAWFFGDTETEALHQLTVHGLLRHDQEPDEVALDVREA